MWNTHILYNNSMQFIFDTLDNQLLCYMGSSARFTLKVFCRWSENGPTPNRIIFKQHKRYTSTLTITMNMPLNLRKTERKSWNLMHRLVFFYTNTIEKVTKVRSFHFHVHPLVMFCIAFRVLCLWFHLFQTIEFTSNSLAFTY